MQTKTKRTASLLLALVFTLALLAVTPLTVKAAGEVCQIGSTGYPTLKEAITYVIAEQTITLLDNITTSTDITVDRGFPFTIDTNGKRLTFGNDFYVEDSSDVTINGSVYTDGAVEVVAEDGSKLTITGSVTSTNTAEDWYVLWCAEDGSELHIGGGITTSGCGIGASDDVTVTVGGSITATGILGVQATGGARVTVGGGVTVGDSEETNGAIGIKALGGESAAGSTVTVGGNVLVNGSYGTGIDASDSTVTVTGSVTADNDDGYVVHGENGHCVINIIGSVTNTAEYLGSVVYAVYGARIAVGGNVVAYGNSGYAVETAGVFSFIAESGTQYVGSEITIGGNVVNNCSVEEGYAVGVYTNGGKVTVNGSVTSSNNNVESAVVFCDSQYYDIEGGEYAVLIGEVYVKGSVTNRSTGEAAAAGVSASSGSKVTVDGTINASQYIRINGNVKEIGENEPTSTKTGYREYTVVYEYEDYTENEGWVWVKIPAAAPPPPPPAATPVTPSPTPEPTPEPTLEATPEPTPEPTPEATHEPTPVPTVAPTPELAIPEPSLPEPPVVPVPIPKTADNGSATLWAWLTFAATCAAASILANRTKAKKSK